MKKNVGNTDRVLRVTAGVIILLLGVFFQSWWGLLGIIPVVTGLVRFCPLYLPFGISTVKEEPQQTQKV